MHSLSLSLSLFPPRCQFIRYSHNYPELSGTRPPSPPPYVPKFVFDCHFAFRSSSGPHLINGRRVMLVNARFQFNLCAANFDRGCRCREISGGSGRRKIARNVKFHEGTWTRRREQTVRTWRSKRERTGNETPRREKRNDNNLVPRVTFRSLIAPRSFIVNRVSYKPIVGFEME